MFSLGFEWFGDQRDIEGVMLDLLWREKGFKWYRMNVNTARHLFDLSNVQGRIEEESTRKQFLGFVNTILLQGLGVKIKSIGKGTVQRNYFGLYFDVPFIIPNIGRCRSDTFNHIQDVHLLILKPFHSPSIAL